MVSWTVLEEIMVSFNSLGLQGHRVTRKLKLLQSFFYKVLNQIRPGMLLTNLDELKLTVLLE